MWSNINPMARSCWKINIFVKIWPKFYQISIFLAFPVNIWNFWANEKFYLIFLPPLSFEVVSLVQNQEKWGVATNVHFISKFREKFCKSVNF
jgi:hypothetical protein